MIMTKVASTNVDMIGYNPKSNTLHIKYKSGAEYSYSNVPESVHKEIMESKSIGSFVYGHIKGKFICKSVPPAEAK